MSQLADVNSQSTVGVFHFYILTLLFLYVESLLFCGTMTLYLITAVKKPGLRADSQNQTPTLTLGLIVRYTDCVLIYLKMTKILIGEISMKLATKWRDDRTRLS